MVLPWMVPQTTESSLNVVPQTTDSSMLVPHTTLSSYAAAIVHCSWQLSPPHRFPQTTLRGALPTMVGVCVASRSEERRVGQECRSRWAGEHVKKTDEQT